MKRKTRKTKTVLFTAGSFALLITVITFVLDLPVKLMNVYNQYSEKPLEISVRSLSFKQKPFLSYPLPENGRYKYLDWNGVFELTSLMDSDVSLTNFSVAFKPIGIENETYELVSVDRFKDQGLSATIYMSGLESGSKASAIKTITLPYQLKAHEKLQISFHLRFELRRNGESLSYATEDSLYYGLAYTLQLPMNEHRQYQCAYMNMDVEIEAWKRKGFSNDVKTLVIFPGCILNLPPKEDIKKLLEHETNLTP